MQVLDTITTGDCYGWLDVVKPRIAFKHRVWYHRCLCKCGNPVSVEAHHYKLLAGEQVTCGKCNDHRLPVKLFSMPRNLPGEVSKFIARNGVWCIFDSAGKIVWERKRISRGIPYPYRLCRNDVVVVAGTSYVGIVHGYDGGGRIFVDIRGKRRNYDLKNLLLIERPA